MNLTEGIVQKKIIANKVLDWNTVKIVGTTLKNDLYEKHLIEVLVQGEMLICNDISKMKVYSKKIKKETYTQYLIKIASRDLTKDQWIYRAESPTWL